MKYNGLNAYSHFDYALAPGVTIVLAYRRG